MLVLSLLVIGYLPARWICCITDKEMRLLLSQGCCFVDSNSQDKNLSLLAPSLSPTTLSLFQLCLSRHVLRCLISDSLPGMGMTCVVRCAHSLAILLSAYKTFD